MAVVRAPRDDTARAAEMGAQAKSINSMSCSDKVQRCSTTCELGRINALIKGGQFASMLHGESEKVEVGGVRGSREVWEGMGIRGGKVVGPKLVTWSGSKCV